MITKNSVGTTLIDPNDTDPVTSLNTALNQTAEELRGYRDVPLTGGGSSYTLSLTDDKPEGRTPFLRLTGSQTVSKDLLIDPSQGLREFTIWNATTEGGSSTTVTVKTTAGGSTGVLIDRGEKAEVWHDGTHVYKKGGGATLAYTSVNNFPTNRIAGRSTAGTGALEALTPGTGISINGGVVSASVAPFGTKVVFASQIPGVVLDANLSTGAGTDNTTLLQAVLDTAPSYNHLILVIDGKTVVTGLRLRSNTTLMGMSEEDGIVLKAGSLRAPVANYNRTAVVASRQDKNITIKDLLIDGNYAGLNPGGTLNGGRYEADGQTLMVGLQFFGVDNLKIQNVRLRQARTYGMHLLNVDRVRIEHCYVSHTDLTALQNNDGVHFNGNSSNIYGFNNRISGTADDGVAFNSDDIAAAGPYAVASNGGPITNVYFDRTFFDTCYFGFRFLSNGTPGGASLIDRVTLSNTVAHVSEYMFRFDSHAAGMGNSNPGNIGRVEINGVDASWYTSSVPQNYGEAVRVECRMDTLIVRGFRANGGTWHTDGRPILKVLGGQTIGGIVSNPSDVKLLELEYWQYDPAGSAPTATQRVQFRGNVEKAVVKGNHGRDSSVSQLGGAIHIWGDDINEGVTDLTLSGSFTRQQNLVVNTAGKLTRLRLDNVTDESDAGSTILLNNVAAVSETQIFLNGLALPGTATFKTDAGAKGTVHTSGAPNYGARVTLSANQSINSGAATAINWGVETFDDFGLHSTSSNTNRFTAPEAGYYEFRGLLRYAASSGGSYREALLYYLDGSTLAVGVSEPLSAANTTDVVLPPVTFFLAASQWVEMRALHDAGAALNVLSTFSYFECRRVR